MSDSPCEVCHGARFRSLFVRDGQRFQRCEACGLERISPQPSDETLGSIYSSKYYEGWGMHSDAQMVISLKRATFLPRMRQLKSLRRGARILDCGAATGILLDVACEEGYDPYGVELNDVGAREITERFGPHHLFHGPFDRATFGGIERGGFDAIFMYDFLEHVRDPRATLLRAFEMLAPGGWLSVCTPCAGSLSHHLMGRHWRHYLTEHLFYFRVSCLTSLLRESGFSGIQRRAAQKAMSFRYMHHWFTAHRSAFLTPVFHGLAWVLPERVQKMPVRLLLGEMLVHAQKPTSAANTV